MLRLQSSISHPFLPLAATPVAADCTASLLHKVGKLITRPSATIRPSERPNQRDRAVRRVEGWDEACSWLGVEAEEGIGERG